ncbi:UTP--glucose-1-phosphate uridylyltransferase [Actinotalea sp. M2MS4P-6]|uniref:UTP--glucose-1-phosphate uridylyltransferase n=1 Tax=Actinotalea sp. M2MS4P-6 TaxID=2983762 RepID=UPI0021E41B16|nr:UTP--glucose-1-phosphate uridylyltransferase [Actinotalea sp. M2MS4P-6]MCV2395781.1 UTP--glucose-1-phosphate uridylyltransferase [Actinotalea sp. M2MS4P-6]
MEFDGLARARSLMRDIGVHPHAIEVFSYYYRVLAEGETGVLAESDLEPVAELPHIDDLEVDDDAAAEALRRTVVVKLNGGLGTSMGMDRAKSLVEVRPGRSFLDLIAQQVLDLRSRYDADLPLLMMNSFRTREDTLAALGAHPELPIDGLPLDFLQHQEPKLLVDDLTPVSWPADPSLEWCPPGHGDIYTALETSGVLAMLLERGYRYMFVSNADNLGAWPDPRLAEWFAGGGFPFAAEFCRRTAADRKGGHLARRRADGQLVLRELAQTHDEDAEAFGDVDRHRFFNTNNLWLDLHALDEHLRAGHDVLGLPLIRNVKNVDPSDPSSPRVVQIETAMGAAIGVFDGAAAIEVDRSRFLPVKTTSDLLVLRSDAYRLNDGGELELATGGVAPLVHLGDAYRLLPDFDARFPSGAPSLVGCESLVVTGDWTFGRDVRVRGVVHVAGEGGTIPDGAVLDDALPDGRVPEGSPAPGG